MTSDVFACFRINHLNNNSIWRFKKDSFISDLALRNRAHDRALGKKNATGLHLDLLWLIERWKATRPERSQLQLRPWTTLLRSYVCVQFKKRLDSTINQLGWHNKYKTQLVFDHSFTVGMSRLLNHTFKYKLRSWGVLRHTWDAALRCVRKKNNIFVCTLFESTHVILFEASRSFRLR